MRSSFVVSIAVAAVMCLPADTHSQDVVLLGASDTTIIAEDARMLWQSWKCYFYQSASRMFSIESSEMFDESLAMSRHLLPKLRESAVSLSRSGIVVISSGPSDDFIIGGIEARAAAEASSEIFGDRLFHTLNLLVQNADIEMLKAKWTEQKCDGVHAYIKGRNVVFGELTDEGPDPLNR